MIFNKIIVSHPSTLLLIEVAAMKMVPEEESDSMGNDRD